MLLRFVVVCSAVFALGGCLSHVQPNGYPLANIKFWDNVKEGSTRVEVERTLGHPIVQEGNSWIYPSCLVYRVAASIVQKYSCDVLKVTFNDKDTVEEVERFRVPVQRLRKVSKSGSPVTGVHDGVWRRITRVIGLAG